MNWISVNGRLPENEQEVLVCTKSKNGSRNVDKGYWFVDRWIHRGSSEVTHWMPLPPLPGDGTEHRQDKPDDAYYDISRALGFSTR